MGSHSVTCHPTQVNVPCLNLSWPRWLGTYRDVCWALCSSLKEYFFQACAIFSDVVSRYVFWLECISWETQYWFDIQSHHLNLQHFVYETASQKLHVSHSGPLQALAHAISGPWCAQLMTVTDCCCPVCITKGSDRLLWFCVQVTVADVCRDKSDADDMAAC